MAVLARALSFLGALWVVAGLLIAAFGFGLVVVGEGLKGKRVRDWLAAVVQFFMGTDEKTWAGHAVQGLGLGFAVGLLAYWPGLGVVPGVLFVVGAFAHREAEDLLVPALDHGWRYAWKNKGADGVVDLMAPYAAAVLGQGLALLLVT